MLWSSSVPGPAKPCSLDGRRGFSVKTSADAAHDCRTDLGVRIDGQSVEQEPVAARQQCSRRLVGILGTGLPKKRRHPLDHDGSLAQQGREDICIVRRIKGEREAHSSASCVSTGRGLNQRADDVDDVPLSRRVPESVQYCDDLRFAEGSPNGNG